MHVQEGDTASFAKASLSRLGESCKSFDRVLARAFRSGDLVRGWATQLGVDSPKQGREETWEC